MRPTPGQMKSETVHTLVTPGDHNPCVSNKGWVDGHQPSILLLAVYRDHTNSPCMAYLNCYPNGRMQVRVIEGDSLARKILLPHEMKEHVLGR